ncbi:E3 ubiquitin-protein ligase MYLIP-like [Uloborus diversus]|uniref:E3 ubiquitin-protein ligase MYLIP-like n=1 Tax=Uloborus diversus TaxID=327109 RepID=UPI002409C781|nr:E3 ubiquitin-protein ligase MYLIP-like [Uloborus diversus]
MVDTLCLKTVIFSNVMSDFAGVVAENVIYVIQLIFRAILLILQLGPNLIICLYQLVIYLLNHLWAALNILLSAVLNVLCNLGLYFLNVIFNVPPKAYLGLILLVTLIYMHKYFSMSLKIYALFLLAFISKVIEIIIQYVHAFLKSTTKIFIKLFRRRNSSHLVNERNNHQHTNRISKIYNCLRAKRNILTFSFYKTDDIADEKVKYLQQELTAAIDRQLCIICHERERNVIFFPCRHLCLCKECTETLQRLFQDCPICRMRILNVLPVYT